MWLLGEVEEHESCNFGKGLKIFLEDDWNDTNKEIENNWWQIWNYQMTKKKCIFIVYSLEKCIRFEE
jgi:hypothetical protein